jgi:hypothetical protein
MLRSLKEIGGFKIEALDGEIGKVSEFYFDDLSWTIRYLVADTGDWLSDRKVLISPVSLDQPGGIFHKINVKLTREMIEKSPPLSTNEPVFRQKEKEIVNYFKNWPEYWISSGSSLPFLSPHLPENYDIEPSTETDTVQESNGDPHLRSSDEVIGYFIEALNGRIGHVEDFIFEDEDWRIRYMVVDTSNWLPFSKKVLISPSWIEAVLWSEESVKVDLTRELIEKSPVYDPKQPINRVYEERLYDYYGRPLKS